MAGELANDLMGEIPVRFHIYMRPQNKSRWLKSLKMYLI